MVSPSALQVSGKEGFVSFLSPSTLRKYVHFLKINVHCKTEIYFFFLYSFDSKLTFKYFLIGLVHHAFFIRIRDLKQEEVVMQEGMVVNRKISI